MCGPVGSTEQQRRLKTITPKLSREEIEGTLAAIKGTLVVTNGVNMVRSSVMVGMGLCETAAPYVGMQLGGLTSELANKKAELELIATQMVLDSYDAYAQKMKPEYQLFMLCSSSAFACHSRNMQIQQQHAQEASQQPIDPDVEQKYSGY